MRAVVQRVSKASVTVNDEEKAAIGKGFLILLGIETGDTEEDVEWLAGKVAKLRIFPDEEGKMNRAIEQVDGEALVVSQFTLHASTKKGTRPSYIKAAGPDQAVPLYEKFVEGLSKAIGKNVETGKFGAMMEVSLVNDGPVTIPIDSKQKE